MAWKVIRIGGNTKQRTHEKDCGKSPLWELLVGLDGKKEVKRQHTKTSGFGSEVSQFLRLMNSFF